MKTGDGYHHGHLRDELIRLGLEALETEGSDALSLRLLAEKSGVSKTAPYRHFKDREMFLGALANEGFHLLYNGLEEAMSPGKDSVQAMGTAYMDFAVAHPALYRLMNSPIVCMMPDDLMPWPRRSLMLLAKALSSAFPDQAADNKSNIDAVTAAWGYIHGIVLLRIDKLFPPDLPEPDWAKLASSLPPII
jgi:AcrR family transcriptional regulator